MGEEGGDYRSTGGFSLLYVSIACRRLIQKEGGEGREEISGAPQRASPLLNGQYAGGRGDDIRSTAREHFPRVFS